MKIKLFCAAAIAAFALSACGNSIDSKIDRLEKIATEVQAAQADNDYEKMMKLGQEMIEIGSYLNEHESEMTPEQASRLLSLEDKFDI